MSPGVAERQAGVAGHVVCHRAGPRILGVRDAVGEEGENG